MGSKTIRPISSTRRASLYAVNFKGGEPMQKITSMLWFDDQAEAAADHYISVFSRRPGSNRGQSRVLDVTRYGEAGPGPAGSVMVVRLALEGQEVTALNGGAAPVSLPGP